VDRWGNESEATGGEEFDGGGIYAVDHEILGFLHVLVVAGDLVEKADALGSETPAGGGEKVLKGGD
jgi:hypothetical protein